MTDVSLNPYLRRVAQMESGMNPYARNPASSAKGLFQFTDKTAKAYGLEDPFDPAKSAAAAQKLTEDNRRALRSMLGREPTEQELYLAHQQGATGAARIINNETLPIHEVVGQDAASLNAAQPGMTAGDFKEQIFNKFDKTQDAHGIGFVEVETPDGIVEFPADMTEQEIVTALRRLYPMQEQKPSPASVSSASPPVADKTKSPSFLARIGKDAERRYGQALASVQRPPTIPYLEPAFEIAGQAGLGFAGDVVGNVVQSAASGLNDLSGGRIGRAAGSALSAIGKLPSFGGGTIGERIPGELASVGRKYDQFAKENPGAAAKMEAGFNLATVGIAPFKASKIGSKVSKVGDKVGDIGRAKLITSEMKRAESSAAYDAAEKAGGFLDPSVTDDFLIDVLNKIEPKTQEAKTAFKGAKLTEVDDTIYSMIDLSGKPLSLKGVEEIDQKLTDLKRANFNPATGGYNETGNKYRIIQDSLRDAVDQAIAEKRTLGGDKGFKALKEASRLWSQRIKLKNIEDAIETASRMDQPAKALSTRLHSLLENDKKIKPYSKAEREAIKEAADLDNYDEALRFLGSRLSSVLGLGSGNVLGAGALAISGKAARSIGSSRKIAQAQKAGQVIAYGGKAPKDSALSLVTRPTGSGIRAAGSALSAIGSKKGKKLLTIEAADKLRGDGEEKKK